MRRFLFPLYVLSILVVVLVTSECSLNYMMNHSKDYAPALQEKLSQYYHLYECRYIQLEPTMARYDSSLFYTLRPGTFEYNNREFSTQYAINSLGCRDSEDDLNFPEIVVLGDSYAMGWGVEAEACFANRIEAATGLRVLNAAISSYGTPRQMGLLNRIQTDSLKYLIIQYCGNDYREIYDYAKNKDQLKVSSESIYDSLSNHIRHVTRNYPLKLTRSLLPTLFGLKEFAQPVESEPLDPRIQVPNIFLDLIRLSDQIPAQTTIYVFHIYDKGFNNNFLNQVKALLDQSFDYEWSERIQFIDLSDSFEDHHYFDLDMHINNRGHQLVADSLIQRIQNEPKGPRVKHYYYNTNQLAARVEYMGYLRDGRTTYYWNNGRISQPPFSKMA
ncbi:MAG: SGNH/GDSL hydrolase family protein [Bacteroidota bacterium]